MVACAPVRAFQPGRRLRRSSQILYRLRKLPPREAGLVLWWSAYTAARGRLGRQPSHDFAEADLGRWFGANAPILYHQGFGTTPGPHVGYAGGLADAADPRVLWEARRDQDLAAVLSRVNDAGWHDRDRALIRERFSRLIAVQPPNAMEAALRCVTWLEAARFISSDDLLTATVLPALAKWLLATGAFIERRLHEIPLGGNHYLSHAVGLLFLGRLLPGRRDSDRWARRGQRILEQEVLRQFHGDGGGYEQSVPYQLFSLDLVLGSALLLRGQGVTLPEPVVHRVRVAACAVAALLRPDGSIPLLGDDDSGRLHRWGSKSTGAEICALAALLTNDPNLALAAAGEWAAASWLGSPDAPRLLQSLASAGKPPKAGHSLPRTGLHVVRTANVHAVLWSRDPAPPAMLAHGHSDHNSVDIWAYGQHIIRDPGSGMYLGDTKLRNLLRASEAHSTLSVDRVEISPFRPADLFFMPPLTRGRRVEWDADGADRLTVATTHDGFRRCRGKPVHRRRLSVDANGVIEIDDLVHSLIGGRHHVSAWWHWAIEPRETKEDRGRGMANWTFRVGSRAIELVVPAEADVRISEPFPWSPQYGTVEVGRRTVVSYDGPLPFRMSVRVGPARDLE
jgi:hypothetical protein